MFTHVRHVLVYRFARRFRRRWLGVIAVTLVIGVVGGVGLAALAGARATQRSEETLLAHANPSQMNVILYAPNLSARLDRLPYVKHVEGGIYSFAAFPLNKKGHVVISPGLNSGEVSWLGSVGGEYFNQDRVSVTAGRMANAHRANEFVATATTEKLMNWHVGEYVEMAFYNFKQSNSADPYHLKNPIEQYREHLVGTVIFNNDVAQDEVDEYPSWFLFTPALTKPLDTGPQYINYALQLDGPHDVTKVEHEIIKLVPPGETYSFQVTSFDQRQVDLSVRPEALALGVFGLLLLASALLIGLQIVARDLRAGGDERNVLRALGATRMTIALDAMSDVALAAVGGVVLAVVVATLSSPLWPIGPVGPILDGHLSIDGPVVYGAGALLLVGTLLGAAVLTYRGAPGRRIGPSVRAAGGSHLARLGANAGLAVSAVAGLHFAFESGRGRRSVPVRSMLAGVAVAVTLIGTTLTFSSGLSTLISRPSLYGWNWNYAIRSTGDGVPPATVANLRANPHVAAVTNVTYGDVQLNGVTVPAILLPNAAPVAPPLLVGHGVRSKSQIVLGAATMAALHEHVGGHVELSYGSPANRAAYVAPTSVTIVGSATLPAIGDFQQLHTSMGTGAEISLSVLTPSLKRLLTENLLVSDIDTELVRLTSTTTRAQGRAVMAAAAAVGNRAFAALPNGVGGGISMQVLTVQYPAEIINYRAMGDTPFLLAMGFAVGVVIAFTFTAVSSVRRRRRDLALLKTLGFTRRQLSACIAWQASASVVTGLLIGIPLGTLLGGWSWVAFAHQIYAVPFASVPGLALVLLGLSALVIANVVSFIPGRIAAATSAAIALRSE